MFKLIKKVTGEGIICAVGAGRVSVAPLTPSDDDPLGRPTGKSAPDKKGCSPSGGCGSCGGCLSADSVPDGYIGRFFVDVRAGEACKYAPGDRVRFSRFIPEPNLASALVFGVPISFALAAILFWIAKAPDQIESPLAAFTAIAAFLSGVFIVGIIDKVFKIKFPPTITSTRDGNDDVLNDRP